MERAEVGAPEIELTMGAVNRIQKFPITLADRIIEARQET
jgi:hypothetical protein